MRCTPCAIFAAALLISAALAVNVPPAPTARHDAMAGAAKAFLDTLDREERDRAQLELGDPNRLDWHFVPRPRRGIPLGDLNDGQRVAAHDLLRATLSARGQLKVQAILELEALLYELARARGGSGEFRDPGNYFLTIFGQPGDGPWAWRLEGHHLSLNFTSHDRTLVAATPFFLGAQPATARHGHRAGFRALGAETDLAFALLGSLTGEQRDAAIIAEHAPRDIILGPGTPAERLGDPVGLAASDMTADQRTLLTRLLHEYSDNLQEDFAIAMRERLDTDPAAIHFVWAGSLEPGAPHYWRIHSPRYAIEYDNTQDGANHIHTVWHDFESNFGGDALRHHIERHHADAP